MVLYDQTNELDNVDTARMELFCHGNKSMEKIPPTQCALLQHLKRAAYQTSIWCTCEFPVSKGLLQRVGVGMINNVVFS